MKSQVTTNELFSPNVVDWRVRPQSPQVLCPGGCGEMIDTHLTHQPWACAAAKAGRSGEIATLVNDVRWCSTHSSVAGVVEYLSSTRCAKSVTDNTPCVLHELFYFGKKDLVDERR